MTLCFFYGDYLPLDAYINYIMITNDLICSILILSTNHILNTLVTKLFYFDFIHK